MRFAGDGAFWGISGHLHDCCGAQRGVGVVIERVVAMRISSLLQDRAAMREWDLARAAKVKKVGFSADIEGYFFIFWIWGRCARGMLGSHRVEGTGSRKPSYVPPGLSVFARICTPKLALGALFWRRSAAGDRVTG